MAEIGIRCFYTARYNANLIFQHCILLRSKDIVQEIRAVAMKPRVAAAVLFCLNFKSSRASKARRQSSKHTGAKQNLTQNGHSRSRFGVSGKVIRD